MKGRPIALLTDFGLREPYVGLMKAVALSITPQAVFLDLTHEVAPQAVLQAALYLDQCADFLPPGTVSVSVVDPGVGSGRAILAARVGKTIFLAPDNGLLSVLLARRPAREMRRVENKGLQLERVSKTFEARDRFAVIAAHLAKGLPFSKLGPRARHFKKIAVPTAVHLGKTWRGEVIHIDRFGNAITNLPERALRGALRLRMGRCKITHFVSHYEEGRGSRPFALVNSSGQVEIAVFKGSVAHEHGLRAGQQAVVECR